MAHFTISASLGWVTNFGIWWQLFIIQYLTIRGWNCNCQKITSGSFISILYILFQCFYLTSHLNLILSYLSVIPSYLSFILFQFYLISVLSYLSFILSYFLVLDHLTLKLNKSHNILEKNQGVTTKLLYFVQLTGCQKMFGSVWIAAFTRLILPCQILTFWCWWTFHYKLIIGNDKTHLSIAEHL